MEDGFDGGRVKVFDRGVGEVKGDVEVGDDAGEFLAEVGTVASVGELFRDAPADVVQVGVEVVEGIVIGEEADSGFFADAAHAGDVIRGVADEGFVVYDLIGADAEFFDHIFGGEVFGVAEGFAFGQADEDAVIHELEEVAVAGDDFDADPARGGFAGDTAEHVVGFVAVHFEAGDVEGVYHLPDAFDLHGEVVGHFFPRAFVFGEEIIAKGSAYVEGDHEVVGAVLLEVAQKDAGKPVDARGRFAFGGCPARGRLGAAREGEVSAVGEGVAVYEVESLRHGI